MSFDPVTATPSQYQRILITNITTGGFTDREYDEKRPYSEPFNLSIGSGQHGRFLSVAQGNNLFSWVVSNSATRQQVAAGKASLKVDVRELAEARGFHSFKEDTYCLGERTGFRTSIEKCPNGVYTLERIGMCEDGRQKTLSLQTIYSSNSKPFGPFF